MTFSQKNMAFRGNVAHSDHPWKAISGVDQWYAGLAPLHLALPCRHLNSSQVLRSFTKEERCICSNLMHHEGQQHCSRPLRLGSQQDEVDQLSRGQLHSLLAGGRETALKGFTRKCSTGRPHPILSANHWKTCHIEEAAVGPPAATSFKNSLNIRGDWVLTSNPSPRLISSNVAGWRAVKLWDV